MKAKTLFLSHGGGPLPLLGDPSHDEMVDTLQTIAKRIDKPSAIIIISAHWEENIPYITSAANPDLIYDYYGFPPESYEITYPCTGKPELAQAIHACFAKEGIDSTLNTTRGFDHGLFVPLKIMYPNADIPCIQLSLLKSLDPKQHIQLGKALQDLPTDNLLLIGSGFTFHNMKAFFTPDTTEAKKQNIAFEKWLQYTCSSQSLSEEEREQQLINWENAPAARYCHPREEHLLPLHTCYGFTQSPCSEVYNIAILNKQASMFLWDS